MVLLAALTLYRLEALSSGYLTFDAGMRYHLSGETLRGAVPIRDFEHGWNAGGWYVGAALFWLVGGSAPLWDWLWEVVAGFLLAGVAGLVVLYRLRLSLGWLAAYLAAFLSLQQIPHGKYAIPVLWLLALLPTGWGLRTPAAVAVRFLLGAVTLWLHVDLAIILSAGTGLFDLIARRDLTGGRRLLLAVTPALAAVAAFGAQAWLYQAVFDYPAERLVEFLLLERSTTIEGINFAYPLFEPAAAVQLLYPASLVIPLIPVVWRRLSDPTRLAVSLHLAMSLTGLRKADIPHTEAAAVLLGLVVVLVAHDWWQGRERDDESLAEREGWMLGLLRAAAMGLGGAVWFAASIAVAFRVDSLAAWPAFLVIAAGSMLTADRRASRPGAEGAAFSVGAALAAAALVVAGAAGYVAGQLAEESDPQARILAEQLREAGVEQCLEPGREALVIRHPLGLYTELDLDNPTPFYLFWDGFRREFERFTRLANAGELPTIVQVDDWSPGLRDLGPWIEMTYDQCLEVQVPATGNFVRVWTHPQADVPAG